MTSATPSAIARRSHSAPVLLVERDQLARRPGPRRAPRVGQQHQRQQPRDLAVVRQERVDGARQADRLARQVGAAAARSRRSLV